VLRDQVPGFRVWDSGFQIKVQGLGLRIKDVEFGVQGLGFRV
jgi:hypothetical protein